MNFNLKKHFEYFPNSALQISNERIYGIWMIGNNYQAKAGYHGEYPPSYVKRVFTLLDLPNGAEVLHLFSGSIKKELDDEYTFDINPQVNPNFCGPAEQIVRIVGNQRFDLILADPPYTPRDAEIYGYRMPNIPVVLSESVKVLKPGGMMVWLSTRPPIYRKEDWALKGLIGLHTGTNRVFRSVVFMERREKNEE